MYYVYVLLSEKDGQFYTGYTSDLDSRLDQHKTGKSASTRMRRPLKLFYYEAYTSPDDAKRREAYLKTGLRKRDLRKRLQKVLIFEGLTG